MSSKYFATQSAREVVAHLMSSREAYYTNLSFCGLKEKMRKSYNLYYGNHYDSVGGSAGLARGGMKGELVAPYVNHYRNLIKHTLALTCNQKPAFDVRAINTDPDALDEAKLGNDILESDYKFKHLGVLLKKSAEMSQVLGRGHMVSIWDTQKGEPYAATTVKDPESGEELLDEEGKPQQKLVYEGDIVDDTPFAHDILTDGGLENWQKKDWVDVRLYENKFNLAAKYPDHKEEVASLASKNEDTTLRDFVFKRYNVRETDQVAIYYFFHKKSPALPSGRLTIYCSQDVILYDGPAPPPYDKVLPVFRIIPGEVFGTTEGYSDAFDLLGIQEAINILLTIGITNLNAQGIQKIWIPEGANVSASLLSKGLAIIRTPQGQKPEALQLTANPADLYKGLDFLVKSAETSSGINSVARGDPEHSLKSGIALAYVQAMASQYTSAFQESWANLNEEVASFRIKLYQNYASADRLIALAGKRKKAYVSTFSKNKISKLDRVVCDIGNPLTKTLGGRLEVSENLLQKGMFKTPQDYLTFIETGQPDVMTEDAFDEQMAIKQENDFLMDGKPVKAIPGEKHLLHSQKHMAIISNPAVRMNSQMVKNVLDHIQDHLTVKKTEDPIFSMISGEPPLPPDQPPPGPPGPPGPPPGGPPQPVQGPPPPFPPHPQVHGGHGGPPISQQMQVEAPGNVPHIPRLPGNLQPGQGPPKPG